MNTKTKTITCNAATTAYAEIARLINPAQSTSIPHMSINVFRGDIKSSNLYWIKIENRTQNQWILLVGSLEPKSIKGIMDTYLEDGLTAIVEVVKGEGRSVTLNLVEVVKETVAIPSPETAETETTETTDTDFRSIVEGKPIKVRVNGKVYMGRVVGFKLDYPRIWVREIDADIEFSRQAIIRAVEGDLILDGGTETTPAVETATSPVETTATTPAVETATQTTAPAAKLKMPFNPMQNNAMLHKQIREFLGTDCTVQNVDVEWYEDKEYSVVTTVGTVYEVVLRGDFYVFTKTAETMPPAAELKETTPAMETTAAPATPTPAVETVTNKDPKDPTEDLEYAKAHMEYNFCLVGNYVAYQNAIAHQIATEYTAPPVLVEPVIGGFNTQYYSFIKHEVELTGAYEVQVGYKDPKRGVARCLFPATSMDSDRLAVIEMLQSGLFNGLDTLHYQLRKYRMVLNPLTNDGLGIAQATDYNGKVHRVPFIITFNGLPVSEIAFGEYRDYLSRNW